MDRAIQRCISEQGTEEVLGLLFSNATFENFEEPLGCEIVVSRKPEMVNERVHFELGGGSFNRFEKFLPFNLRLVD